MIWALYFELISHSVDLRMAIKDVATGGQLSRLAAASLPLKRQWNRLVPAGKLTRC